MPLTYIKNVVTLQFNEAQCTGCGMCVIVCPHRIFSVSEGKAQIEDRDLCMECGACMMNCPFDAISVRKGVGCAAAIIFGKLRGTEPTCGCSENDSTTCCG